MRSLFATERMRAVAQLSIAFSWLAANGSSGLVAAGAWLRGDQELGLNTLLSAAGYLRCLRLARSLALAACAALVASAAFWASASEASRASFRFMTSLIFASSLSISGASAMGGLLDSVSWRRLAEPCTVIGAVWDSSGSG